ncbi:protein RESTRICTED TEV MOVEMENT 2 [Canna indica]|uniref:Protein RESTRICTED TEV MOVEMENT 2 n=1 Tax=Canna indica TaxID=4628 RepID=A0AAQ3JYW6_9LILI|nr:protein RESTRICTED TEV MOVEMENT 2 [Canna indica]
MAETTARRVYVDVDPSYDLIEDEENNTFIIHLAGFKKEQLRVQLTTSKKLLITGERPLLENRWTRFRKELQVPTNCNDEKIRARFEDQLLYIVLPKLIPGQQKDDKLKPSFSKAETSKKEGMSSMKRERSNAAKSMVEEKEKEQVKKHKEMDKVTEKKNQVEDGEKGGEKESLKEKMKFKVANKEFELNQTKKLMIGLSVAVVVLVCWYLHHKLTSMEGGDAPEL